MRVYGVRLTGDVLDHMRASSFLTPDVPEQTIADESELLLGSVTPTSFGDAPFA